MWGPIKRVAKQTSLTPLKKQGRVQGKHNKSLSLLQKRPNLALMKWNDFLEKYHSCKQMNMINNSINLVNTFFRHKSQSIRIDDVPYVESQQMEFEDSTRAGREMKQPPTFNNSFQNSCHSVNTEQEMKEAPILMSIRLDESGSSQNFTDEEEEDKKQQIRIASSKNSGSTDKTSSVIERWPIWEIQAVPQKKGMRLQASELPILNMENLTKTACFSQAQSGGSNQENVNLSNQMQNKKVFILQKLHKQQVKARQNISQLMSEDKRYLCRLIKKGEK